MRLGQKNLWYSMTLAGFMLLFLVGYFIYMLPSLYVDYVMEQNLKSIRRQHEAYVEQGSYQGVSVRNSTACISLEIPGEGDYILVTGKAFCVELKSGDERLTRILDSCREWLFKIWDREALEQSVDNLRLELDELLELLKALARDNAALPISLNWRYLQDIEGEFFNESIKIHTYSDHLFILELGIEDANNRYFNYIAIEKKNDRLILSFLPVVAPDTDEIRPVVVQSLPMLGAVILLLVLLFSQMYSRGIVRPIVELAQHAEEMKHTKEFSGKRHKRRDTEDEIQKLGNVLDDLYREIWESYRQLEEKNRELEEENKRQEIFLRASSHQLKTPIAAALLLVDGMMNEIGRYRDTKAYLPKVKEQLLSMRKMVEDILYLNHCAEDMKLCRTDIGEVLAECMKSYQVALTDQEIRVDVPENMTCMVLTDERMICQILDNLLSNAVRYTPVKGHIRILLDTKKQELRIENFGVVIPEELAPHILEPFVSGSHQADASGIRSHGMGLYIASYYARKLGVRLEVRNGEAGDSVVAELKFHPVFI